MKIKLLLLFTLVFTFSLSAQQKPKKSHWYPSSVTASNQRSDTMDIVKYTINLNITSFIDSTISGNTIIKFTPKLNSVNTINLDLLMLTIDSVKSGTSPLTYLYDDTLLSVNLPQLYNIGDTSSLTVYYHGHPQGDASGWGGFYFTPDYAYNLGVGFASLPHNYGRVWYPCFDNFVERATYEFNIVTNNGKTSYCNGYLAHDTTDLSGNRTRKWIMEKEIPSYLASVAVAAYAQINETFNAINGPMPVSIAALPVDTAHVKAAFINLPLAFSTLENHFGPYLWNKVGYCMVPFNSGAMEHATTISYPLVVTGSAYGTAYQSMMAHELSHHWFGDLATCRTAQDMWLNEGWARYCEFLFYEALNGYSSYLSNVRTNHESNLQFLHVKEGGYQTLSNIPLNITYGDHVYNKGADVAHTLRSYFDNDTLFYSSLKTYLSQHHYADVSSQDFMVSLNAASGLNLNDFFNDWVFNPGWTHFSIDSSVVTPSGTNYNVTVYVKQKLTGAPAYFNSVPLEITFKAANWVEQIKKIMMSGSNGSFSFTLPFNPVFVAVNMSEKISHAVAPEYHIIKTSGNTTFANAMMTLNVSSISDSALVRVEHNFTAPDDYHHCCKPYKLSPNHYWKIDGILPANFKSTATIYYDGRSSAFASTEWLDNNLVGTYEDSIVLLYRRNTADDWNLYPYFTKNYLGSHTDKHGLITIDTLRLGEYVFATNDYLLGIKSNSISAESIAVKVFPNPTANMITVDLTSTINKIADNSLLIITDITGRIIYTEKLNQQNTVSITTSAFDNGIYFVSLKSKDKIIANNKFIVAH